jgi:renal tumor antigen
MDLWGVGCVLFEIISLFPAFPGNDELDQIKRIHNILGTPSIDLLNHFKQHATHMEFNFPKKMGTGIKNLIPHATPDCVDLIEQLLKYDPDERITASDALKHPYFRDLWEMDVQKELSTSLHSVSKFSNLSFKGQ